MVCLNKKIKPQDCAVFAKPLFSYFSTPERAYGWFFAKKCVGAKRTLLKEKPPPCGDPQKGGSDSVTFCGEGGAKWCVSTRK